MNIIRWHEETPPDEHILRERMRQEGLSPYAWSNGPGVIYAVHCHSYQTVLYCVRGSIRFSLPDSCDAAGTISTVELVPGDCMLLPPGARHSAQVGSQGVTCLEAPRY